MEVNLIEALNLVFRKYSYKKLLSRPDLNKQSICRNKHRIVSTVYCKNHKVGEIYILRGSRARQREGTRSGRVMTMYVYMNSTASRIL